MVVLRNSHFRHFGLLCEVAAKEYRGHALPIAWLFQGLHARHASSIEHHHQHTTRHFLQKYHIGNKEDPRVVFASTCTVASRGGRVFSHLEAASSGHSQKSPVHESCVYEETLPNYLCQLTLYGLEGHAVLFE